MLSNQLSADNEEKGKKKLSKIEEKIEPPAALKDQQSSEEQNVDS